MPSINDTIESKRVISLQATMQLLGETKETDLFCCQCFKLIVDSLKEGPSYIISDMDTVCSLACLVDYAMEVINEDITVINPLTLYSKT